MRNLPGMLDKLADTLQMGLHYSARSGRVKGHRQMKVTLCNGVKLPVDVEIEASFLYPAGEQSALLCKMGGSLHILTCYAGLNDTVSLYVLDARNFKGGQNKLRKVVTEARDLKDLIYHLKPGIADSYLKKPRQEWRSFEITEACL